MSKWVKVNSNGQIQLNIHCYEKDVSFGKPAEKRNLMLIYFSSEIFFLRGISVGVHFVKLMHYLL